MQKAQLYNKYKKYIFLGIGFIVTILLTIAIIYINKVIFSNEIFKTIEDNASIKRMVNNLLGFTEGIVVISTFIIFLLESPKEEKKDE